MRADLVLWRHAEAFEPGDGSDDLDRALTPKGERQAQRMAGWLNRQLPAGARVLASPARRAQQTAQALDRRFRTVATLAPGCTVEALLAAARWPKSSEPVLIVGHQPVLGMTLGQLLVGRPLALPLRKGGIVWLRGRDRDGELQVTLHAALAPDQL